MRKTLTASIVAATVLALPLSASAAPRSPSPDPSVASVSALSPNSGTTAGGTAVTITGAGFTGASEVSFGGVLIAAAQFTSSSDTQIVVTSPAHMPGHAFVSVEVGGQFSRPNGSSFFNYVAPKPVAPVLTALSPSTGPAAGGTTVTISGSGFTGVTAVSFGGVLIPAAQFTSSSDTQIVLTAPAHKPGGAVVAVEVNGVWSDGHPATAHYVFTGVKPAAPSVTALSPSSGPTAGGQTVTISGTGFTGATAVSFGGVLIPAAQFLSINDEQVVVTSPAHRAGAAVVQVGLGSHFSESRANKSAIYTYQGAKVLRPTVSALSPSSGPAVGGQTVAITGTGFTGATQVDFGGVLIPAAQFTSSSDTQIVVTSPAHKPGGTWVAVETNNFFSQPGQASRYTYLGTGAPAPKVSAISPTSGPVAGGTTVTITGTGLSGAQGVDFGGVLIPAAQFVTLSSTQIVVTSPAHRAGEARLRVFVDGFGSADADGAVFVYQAAPSTLPTVTALSPTSGPSAGGTAVTITGTSFTGATAVAFGGLLIPAAQFTAASDTQIVVTSPAHLPGNVSIEVLVNGVLSRPGDATRFTYTGTKPAQPTATSISPSTGPAAGGTTVTITGTALSGALAVSFGGVLIPAAQFISASDTQIVVLSPAHRTGNAEVSVEMGSHYIGELHYHFV